LNFEKASSMGLRLGVSQSQEYAREVVLRIEDGTTCFSI
jgi:hypothetical protein